MAKVSRRDYWVTLDNITVKTGDQKLKPLPIQLSHLVITRLNLSDPWRRRFLAPRGQDTELTEEELDAPDSARSSRVPCRGKEAEPAPDADAETAWNPSKEPVEGEAEEEAAPTPEAASLAKPTPEKDA